MKVLLLGGRQFLGRTTAEALLAFGPLLSCSGTQKGGTMLGPGDGSDHLLVIDVRDLARFAVALAGRDIGSVFNPPDREFMCNATLFLHRIRTLHSDWKEHLFESKSRWIAFAAGCFMRRRR